MEEMENGKKRGVKKGDEKDKSCHPANPHGYWSKPESMTKTAYFPYIVIYIENEILLLK